jgi:glycosyltransferase involved in cell wall biosynthesis
MLSHMSTTLVSAIIPTRGRPALVQRAVDSVLKQTYQNIEAIVVIDGPDEATREALRTIVDNRLRIVELDHCVGGSDARNTGVREAHGEWVAFLDDDDEWLPSKIQKQLDLAVQSRSPSPIVTCYFIGRTPSGDYIWPRRTPRHGEALCEYLFVKSGLFRGEAQLQTSLLFARRQLFEDVPFTSGLRRHQDTDWYVRVAGLDAVAVEFVREPLAIWYVEENRPKISGLTDWRNSLAWLRSRRELITPRAYTGFIATQLAPEAAQQGDWQAFFPLLQEAVFVGSPEPYALLHYFGMWFVPVTLRRILRRVIRRVSPARVEHVE